MTDVRQILIGLSWSHVQAGQPRRACARCGAECGQDFVWSAPEFPDDPKREACVLCAESDELGLWLAARDKAMRPWP